MKLNKKRPWLPQERPPLLTLRRNLDKQIRQAKSEAIQARKKRIAAGKNYRALLKSYYGPVTEEIIVAQARSVSTWRESRNANEELRRLLAMKKNERK